MLKKFYVIRLVSFNNATSVIVCLFVLLMVCLLSTESIVYYLTGRLDSLLRSDNESIRKDSYDYVLKPALEATSLKVAMKAIRYKLLWS
mmetsp:Transcript_26392/g.39993  ORF Transcript_26392/g.39993 Transcript_26392/m.39993 type:complete len:89 (-) Transcript_26392:1385-1651(-)